MIGKSDVLIVVDMQNDFITGSLGTKEAEAIVDKVAALIEEYHKNDGMVFATMDTHRSLSYLDTIEGQHLPVKHCIQDTEGWQLHAKIDKLINPYYRVLKETFGAKMLPVSIDHELIKTDHMKFRSITLVGLCTDICVISNAVMCKAWFPDTPIRVIANACAGSTPEAHQKAIELMRDSLQIDII